MSSICSEKVVFITNDGSPWPRPFSPKKERRWFKTLDLENAHECSHVRIEEYTRWIGWLRYHVVVVDDFQDVGYEIAACASEDEALKAYKLFVELMISRYGLSPNEPASAWTDSSILDAKSGEWWCKDKDVLRYFNSFGGTTPRATTCKHTQWTVVYVGNGVEIQMYTPRISKRVPVPYWVGRAYASTKKRQYRAPFRVTTVPKGKNNDCFELSLANSLEEAKRLRSHALALLPKNENERYEFLSFRTGPWWTPWKEFKKNVNLRPLKCGTLQELVRLDDDPTGRSERGVGAYGAVSLVTLTVGSASETFCMKRFRTMQLQTHRHNMMRELYSLTSCQDIEEAVNFYYSCLEPKNASDVRFINKAGLEYTCEPFILLQAVVFGEGEKARSFTLDHLVHGDPELPNVCEENIKRVLKDVCVGMSKLHERGLVHRDLKPGNIMIDVRRDHTWKGVIIDFGLARLVTQNGASYAGTPGYMAPEIETKGVATYAVDVFSFGRTLQHVVDSDTVRLALAETDLKIFEETVCKCLDEDHPEDRPTFVALSELF